ncbi:tigger transposable element-derived 6-like [Paramuricea clavata]|uniref:Tigger transposable element-derived 6-like n=1 Tax=Paramuricea clavata TaxID=317549 RepID=A0A6S7IE66_PARCT|nr:tigger transposable element-derived 6-like [Paramuricea clavata]
MSINGQCVERVHSFKLLGAYLSDDLTWNTHVDHILKKANSRLPILRLLKKAGLGHTDLITIYCSVIRSILEYASPVWAALPDYLSSHLESVQKRALLKSIADLKTLGDEILSAFEANCSSDTKGSRGGKNAEIDSALLAWFRKARSKNIPISGPILQEKAMQIAKALDVAPSEFKALNGYLDRFKNRNNIKARFISGEVGDVNETTVDSWKEKLPEIVQGWEPENIWNMDETGGGKKSKERLTCAFFVNAKGGKEKPIVIGKSAKPRYFKGISDRSKLPCVYFNQRKAWMESEILEEILINLNRRLKTQNRRILLFMDNAPCHPEDLGEKFTQIKVLFLPANITSRLQPLDLGIIQEFKLKYYRCLLTHVVSTIDVCSSASEVCKSIDVLQAMRWTAMAWNDVSESTESLNVLSRQAYLVLKVELMPWSRRTVMLR